MEEHRYGVVGIYLEARLLPVYKDGQQKKTNKHTRREKVACKAHPQIVLEKSRVEMAISICAKYISGTHCAIGARHWY